MSTKKLQEDLCCLISCIIHYEKEIEIQRKNIAENERYDPLQVFSQIIKDHTQNPFIDRNTLKKFIGQTRQALSDKGAQFFIDSFSTQPQLGLSIDDFYLLVLPRTDQELTNRVMDRGLKNGTNNNLYKSYFYIQEQISKLILLEYQFLNELESKKINFVSSYNWDLLKVYKLFDPLNTGKIGYKEFKGVMNKNNYIFTQEMYKIFLRRTNKNEDQFITKDEFFDQSFILPALSFPDNNNNNNNNLNNHNNPMALLQQQQQVQNQQQQQQQQQNNENANFDETEETPIYEWQQPQRQQNNQQNEQQQQIQLQQKIQQQFSQQQQQQQINNLNRDQKQQYQLQQQNQLTFNNLSQRNNNSNTNTNDNDNHNNNNSQDDQIIDEIPKNLINYNPNQYTLNNNAQQPLNAPRSIHSNNEQSRYSSSKNPTNRNTFNNESQQKTLSYSQQQQNYKNSTDQQQQQLKKNNNNSGLPPLVFQEKNNNSNNGGTPLVMDYETLKEQPPSQYQSFHSKSTVRQQTQENQVY